MPLFIDTIGYKSLIAIRKGKKLAYPTEPALHAPLMFRLLPAISMHGFIFTSELMAVDRHPNLARSKDRDF